MNIQLTPDELYDLLVKAFTAGQNAVLSAALKDYPHARHLNALNYADRVMSDLKVTAE